MGDNTTEIIEIPDDDVTKIMEIEDDHNINPQPLIPRPLIYPRDRLKQRKELDIYRKNLELDKFYVSLQNQKFYDVNVSLENRKKKRMWRKNNEQNNTKITVLQWWSLYRM